jgi:hypothetical protein
MAYPAKKIDEIREPEPSTSGLAAVRERALGLNWGPEPEEDNSFMARCAQVEFIEGSPRISCRCSLAEIDGCILRMMIKQMKWQS